MNVRRTAMTLALAGLLFFTGALGVQADADEDLKTEWLPYTGTSLQIGGIGPIAILAPCDQPGVGAVRFCMTLDETDHEDLPDRVAIDLRDDWGMRASGIWEFRDAAGDILWSEAFCGFVNTFVPHAGIGYPNPVELIVYPGVKVDEPDVCGSPGTIGKATVIWRYNAPVFE